MYKFRMKQNIPMEFDIKTSNISKTPFNPRVFRLVMVNWVGINLYHSFSSVAVWYK